MTSYFGKYRGLVVDNCDPEQLGRLRVNVPAVTGDQELWAMPCVPYAGKDIGFFMLPPAGTNIWVEFERGNPEYPVWTGCFWSSGDVPQYAGSPGTKLIRTEKGWIGISDDPAADEIVIETKAGAKIKLSGNIITITNGKGSCIELAGSSLRMSEAVKAGVDEIVKG